MNDEVKMIHFWRGWRAGFMIGFGVGVLLMSYIMAVSS